MRLLLRQQLYAFIDLFHEINIFLHENKYFFSRK